MASTTQAPGTAQEPQARGPAREADAGRPDAGAGPGAGPGASLAERLCAVNAAAAGQDPIGFGGTLTRLLAIETPTPWGESLYRADPGGTVRQRIRALQLAYFERLRAGGQAQRAFASGYPGLYGIAPDSEWSRPDAQRVILATRPEGPACAAYEMAEYLFPKDDPRLVDLARAFYEAPPSWSASPPTAPGARRGGSSSSAPTATWTPAAPASASRSTARRAPPPRPPAPGG
jgi:hypothetical protein